MIKKGSGNLYDCNDNLILENIFFILKQNIIEISGFDYINLTDNQKKFFSISNIIKCIIKADKYNIIINSSVNQEFFNIEKFILKIYDKTILFNNVNDKNIKNVETTLFNFVCDGNNLESIKLNDFEIEIKKLPDYEESIKILNDKQSSFKETYELSLKNIPTELSDEKSIIIILNNLCNFLSYITSNKVSYYRIHYLNEEDQIFMNTLDFKYPPYYIKEIPFKSTVHTRKFSKIKKILEVYYDKYEKLLEDYSLNIIFGFYLDALNQNYLEMKYLSSMTSLETILDSFDKVYEKKMKKPLERKLMKKGIIKEMK